MNGRILMPRPSKQFIDEVCKKLADEGKLVEAGWVGLKLAVLPPNAPDIQLDEMRMAFFAGAQHLFGSMMGMLDAGEDATEGDVNRMDLINAELQQFIKDFKARSVQQHFTAPPDLPQQLEQLGDLPIQPEYAQKMQAVAQTIDVFFNGEKTGKNRTVGFVMLLFEYGTTTGHCNFISNGANRKDIVTLFKEMVAKFEGQPDIEGHA
jgi:hypothetical protein